MLGALIMYFVFRFPFIFDNFKKVYSYKACGNAHRCYDKIVINYCQRMFFLRLSLWLC